MSRGEGPMWRRAKSFATSAEFLRKAVMSVSLVAKGRSGRVGLVGGFIHQSVELAFIGDADLEEPCATGRI